MNRNLADITIVVDRSGSMHGQRSDAEGGINSMIEDQKKQPGEAVLTLIEFNTDYTFVHRATPIGSVSRYVMVPGGGTALLDAVGRAVKETGRRLAAMDEKDRPGLVTFVIVTDGQENSSREFNRQQVRDMITHQQDNYNWKFIFLGANQDAFAEAANLGIYRDGVSNVGLDKFRKAYETSSSKMSAMRQETQSGNVASLCFSANEREAMK